MFRLICSGVVMLLLVAGCSTNDTPTRHNDFTPLTSIEIIAAASSIAAHTSTTLTVIGNFSGQFTRDITTEAVWSSSSPDVAAFLTPEENNRVTGLVPGAALLTATVGNVSTALNVTVTPATITALTINPAAPSVAKGLNSQFAVRGTFSDATTQDLTFDATWASSVPAVATVSDAAGSKGLAQALAVGTATISATFDGVNGATLLTVTAVALQSITVSPANPTLLSQSSRSFQASGLYSDGSTADITSQAVWTSADPDLVTIAANGTAKTVVPGTTSISASLQGISGSSNLKITGGSLTRIVLSPASFRLVKDTSAPMTATGSFSNGSSRDITGVVDWSVANAAIATVTTPGGNQALLNAMAVTAPATPTRVEAKSGLVTADTALTVAAPQLQSLAIAPAGLELTVGSSGRFTVTATFNDGSTQDVTVNADWSSSLDTTAAVDNSGLAKGRVRGVAASDGPVTISAGYGSKIVKAPVTVKTRTATVLTISGNPALAVGNQVRFTATATYSDGFVQDVTEDAAWTTDKSNVAALADSRNQPGQVVAVDAGSAILTAAFGGKTQTVTLTVK